MSRRQVDRARSCRCENVGFYGGKGLGLWCFNLFKGVDNTRFWLIPFWWVWRILFFLRLFIVYDCMFKEKKFKSNGYKRIRARGLVCFGPQNFINSSTSGTTWESRRFARQHLPSFGPFLSQCNKDNCWCCCCYYRLLPGTVILGFRLGWPYLRRRKRNHNETWWFLKLLSSGKRFSTQNFTQLKRLHMAPMMQSWKIKVSRSVDEPFYSRFGELHHLGWKNLILQGRLTNIYICPLVQNFCPSAVHGPINHWASGGSFREDSNHINHHPIHEGRLFNSLLGWSQFRLASAGCLGRQ